MIKLLVESYCHGCPEFYPEKQGGEAYYGNGEIVHLNDIVIKCSEHDRCQRIKKHLEAQK